MLLSLAECARRVAMFCVRYFIWATFGCFSLAFARGRPPFQPATTTTTTAFLLLLFRRISSEMVCNCSAYSSAAVAAPVADNDVLITSDDPTHVSAHL